MFKKFDIVLVDFPFSDLREVKKRPALVINSLEGDNTIFCQITTKRRSISRYEVNLSREDCRGNILFDSFIYVDMIFTLHKSLIYNKIGEVSNIKTKDGINKKIKLVFG